MKKNLDLLIIIISIVFGCILSTTVYATHSNNNNIKSSENSSLTSTAITSSNTTATTTTTTITTTTTTIITTTTTKVEEYPIAKEVWEIMKSYGWSDIICAGIMGNMMRECGGDTFNLYWDIVDSSGNHYGLCQWSYRYHRDVWNKNINEQLEYLRSTLNISIFDKCTTSEEAAYIFCKSYERPAQTDPTDKRKVNAKKAYNYFVEN